MMIDSKVADAGSLHGGIPVERMRARVHLAMNQTRETQSEICQSEPHWHLFGKPTSTGAQPAAQLYSNKQWNGGDALTAFGISQLGARLYDPALGRFLSRDPLLIARTAASTNPYAFASNDPVNSSDPRGL